MIELNLKDETYYIDLSKVFYINGFIDADGDYCVYINFGHYIDFYIDCEDKQEFDYIINKLRNSHDS